MNRITIASLLAAVLAVPAGTAGFYLSKSPPPLPCFAAASGAYRMTDSARANVIVRIDNTAASPPCGWQVVDDPAIARFRGGGRERRRRCLRCHQCHQDRSDRSGRAGSRT